MRGKIEVYKSFGNEDQELVMEGKNTIVDGAGELLADIMTAPASLSSISDLSAILDTSNYTIQAISFGTASDHYRKHGHAWGDAVPNKVINQTSNANLIRVLAIASGSSLVTSSYVPTDAGKLLPSFVTPRQTSLEENTLPSGVYTPTETTLLSLTPNVEDVGHNLNVIPYASSILGTLGNLSSLGAVFGCYPEGSSTGGSQFYVVSSDSNIPLTGAPTEVMYAGTYNSLFNQVGSMDIQGFVNFVGSSTTDDYISSGWSGLTVSANTTTNDPYHTSNTGEIAYKVLIGSGDLGTANLYGGIYNIGLWSMDLCSALKENNPPFAFLNIVNPKKYRLFSKKSLLENICKTNIARDTGDDFWPGAFNYRDLTIVWRMYFI